MSLLMFAIEPLRSTTSTSSVESFVVDSLALAMLSSPSPACDWIARVLARAASFEPAPSVMSDFFETAALFGEAAPFEAVALFGEAAFIEAAGALAGPPLPSFTSC